MDGIYLDNAATSFPKAPGVGAAMADYLERVGCNIGRGGYRRAWDAAGGVLAVREKLRALTGAPSPRNVCFTAGATCGLNILLKGLLRPGDRVLASPMEHNAVLRPLEQLKGRGVAVELLPCTERGELRYFYCTSLRIGDRVWRDYPIGLAEHPLSDGGGFVGLWNGGEEGGEDHGRTRPAAAGAA